MIMQWMNQLVFYFSYSFVRYALAVGILVALCSSLLGVTLVLKRFSFIGHGLSNVAFGAIAIATAMNIANSFLLAIPVTIVSAILLLRMGKNTKINGDAAIAMISVGALAIGYLIMTVFPNTSNLAADVCATLFGSVSILRVDITQVWLSAILSVLVIAVFLMFYHKIFSVTFDEDFASATGTKAKTYNLILAVVIAVIIVMAINLVGTLLISALVVFPAMAAMKVFKNFKAVTICSVVFSVISAALGILISILASTPVGSTIVAVQLAGFVIFWIISSIGGSMKKYQFIGLALIMLCMFAACSETNTPARTQESAASSGAQNSQTREIAANIDVDLTELSGTMASTVIFNLLNNPDDFLGNTIRMRGDYAGAFSEETGSNHHFILIADAGGCCQQGLEFKLSGGEDNQDGYLHEGAGIEIIGVLEKYEESGAVYSYLAVSDILVF